MLDRCIPFYNVILKCTTYEYQKVTLPQGYHFSSYKDGYEKAWANLEYAVGDFRSEAEAEDYFIHAYMQDHERLIQNARFLLDNDNNVIGACMAWEDCRQNGFVASLHWLIVDEQHQGIGLGKALCMEIMNIFTSQNRFPVYIHTQPWSWKAILLYISLGFRLQKTDTFSHYENEYHHAMDTFRAILNEEQFKLLTAATEF